MFVPGHGMGAGNSLAALPPWNPQLIVAGSALAGALLLAAVVIWLVDRWRRKKPEYRLGPNEQLAQFRKLYEQGDISAEEFARIRDLLTERLMHEMETPASPESQLPESPRTPGPTP
jgi:hypothetical protein